LAATPRLPLEHAALARHIYEEHFAGWRPTDPLVGRASGQPAFVERVVLSVSDAWGWEPGWELIQREGRVGFVHNGQMQLLVQQGEFQPPRARVGHSVSVALPCLREGLVPGFLYAFSRAGPIDPAAAHVRIYLNVTPAGGAQLMAELLTGREAARYRFETKIPNDPAAFARRDSMVVYADPDSARALLRLLVRWRAQIRSLARAPTPFAALRVSAGIALAESPPFRDGDAQSFGLHRSGIIATGLIEAVHAGERHPAAWEARIAAGLRSEGIDPTTPYRQRLSARLWSRLRAR
jgi:hypothetical protein